MKNLIYVWFVLYNSSARGRRSSRIIQFSSQDPTAQLLSTENKQDLLWDVLIRRKKKQDMDAKLTFWFFSESIHHSAQKSTNNDFPVKSSHIPQLLRIHGTYPQGNCMPANMPPSTFTFKKDSVIKLPVMTWRESVACVLNYSGSMLHGPFTYQKKCYMDYSK